MAKVLADTIALCAHPHDEDAMVGVLMELFKVPRVSVKIEKARYVEDIFQKHDILSLPALRTVSTGMLEGLGVSVGHAAALVGVLFKPIPAIQVDLQPEVIIQPRQKNKAEVKTFTALTAAGIPELLGWSTVFRPSFVAQMRGQITDESMAVLQAVLYEPMKDIRDDYDKACADNQMIFDQFLTAGKDGMPEELMRQIPQELVLAADGVSALLTTSRKVFAVSDEAAEVVVTYLNAPPAVSLKKKHLLGQAINELQRQMLRAEAMDCKQTATACRMSLRKVVVNIPEAMSGVAALRAANAGREPQYPQMLSMVQGLAEKYAAVKSTEDSSEPAIQASFTPEQAHAIQTKVRALLRNGLQTIIEQSS